MFPLERLVAIFTGLASKRLGLSQLFVLRPLRRAGMAVELLCSRGTRSQTW